MCSLRRDSASLFFVGTHPYVARIARLVKGVLPVVVASLALIHCHTAAQADSLTDKSDAFLATGCAP